MPITVTQLDFTDFEALQDIVQNTRAEVVQLSRGRMSGTMTHLTLDPHLGISTGNFSKSMRARGVLSESRWTLAMMLASNGQPSRIATK